jgi:hypothetical protein
LRPIWRRSQTDWRSLRSAQSRPHQILLRWRFDEPRKSWWLRANSGMSVAAVDGLVKKLFGNSSPCDRLPPGSPSQACSISKSGDGTAETPRTLGKGPHCPRKRTGWPSASTAGLCRVEVWRGGCRSNISVAAPFVWRCLTGSAVAAANQSPPAASGMAGTPARRGDNIAPGAASASASLCRPRWRSPYALRYAVERRETAGQDVRPCAVRVCLLPPAGQSEIGKNSPTKWLCLTELANAMNSDRIRQLGVDRYLSRALPRHLLCPLLANGTVSGDCDPPPLATAPAPRKSGSQWTHRGREMDSNHLIAVQIKPT